MLFMGEATAAERMMGVNGREGLTVMEYSG